MQMEDWNGRAISVARSRGGVLATVNPSDNLVRSGTSPWPPPEILQKFYQSRQGTAFDGADVAEHFGYYCDLQSLNSEDAITWSFFGPLVYANSQTRYCYLSELCRLIDIPAPDPGNIHVWLWRRIPHPENPFSLHSPEIDFGFQASNLLIFGEAKWRSGVNKKQGIAGDKDQMMLRRDFCNRYGAKLFPECQRFVVLGLSIAGDVIKPFEDTCGTTRIQGCNTTWERLASIGSHPFAEEIKRYYSWKLKPPLAAVAITNAMKAET